MAVWLEQEKRRTREGPVAGLDIEDAEGRADVALAEHLLSD